MEAFGKKVSTDGAGLGISPLVSTCALVPCWPNWCLPVWGHVVLRQVLQAHLSCSGLCPLSDTPHLTCLCSRNLSLNFPLILYHIVDSYLHIPCEMSVESQKRELHVVGSYFLSTTSYFFHLYFAFVSSPTPRTAKSIFSFWPGSYCFTIFIPMMT